jgi:hypothetical protein
MPSMVYLLSREVYDERSIVWRLVGQPMFRLDDGTVSNEGGNGRIAVGTATGITLPDADGRRYVDIEVPGSNLAFYHGEPPPSPGPPWITMTDHHPRNLAAMVDRDRQTAMGTTTGTYTTSIEGLLDEYGTIHPYLSWHERLMEDE